MEPWASSAGPHEVECCIVMYACHPSIEVVKREGTENQSHSQQQSGRAQSGVSPILERKTQRRSW